jgi:hypothetical protein
VGRVDGNHQKNVHKNGIPEERDHDDVSERVEETGYLPMHLSQYQIFMKIDFFFFEGGGGMALSHLKEVTSERTEIA